MKKSKMVSLIIIVIFLAGAVVGVSFLLNAGALIYSPLTDTEIPGNKQNFKIPEIIGVASAQEDTEIPKDWYDETVEWWVREPIGHIMGGYESYGNKLAISDFKSIKKPLDEPIKKPDEINEELEELIKNIVEKKIDETNHWMQIKLSISPTDFAVYLAAAKDPWATVRNKLVYLDVDGDGKPEELAALYQYSYNDRIAAMELYPGIEGHYIKIRTGFRDHLINPYDTKEGLGPAQNLIYIENTEEIRIIPDKTINWKDAVGKTPAEVGLDKDDRGIFGRPPDKSQTPEPDTTEEIPTGGEKGIPGFEAIFAVAGLLAVAYILRKKK